MSNRAIPNYLRKAFQDSSGGLATRSNPLMINGNQFAQLDNALINESDILEKCKGYILDGSPFPGTADSFIRMLVNYRNGTSINSLVVAGEDAGNTNATYKVDLKQSLGDGNYSYIGHTTGTADFTNGDTAVTGVGTAWLTQLKAGDKIKSSGQDDTAYTEIASVLTDTTLTLVGGGYLGATTGGQLGYIARIILNTNAIPNAITFNNNLLITNGLDTPLTYDNVTLDKHQSPNIKTAKFLLSHKSRVFWFNWPASPSGMIWSKTNDSATIDGASIATIFSQDNGSIVGAVSFANSIVVFKDNGRIYQILGEFDQDVAGQPAMIRLLDVPDNLGAIAGRTIVINDDNKVYFLSDTGIYTIDTRMFIQKVSWDIQPNIAALAFKSSATATKSYDFTSEAQWNTGTLTNLNTKRTVNGISSYFDTLNKTDALLTDSGVSTFIDSSNNVHTAYISADGTSVLYRKLSALDNTETTTTVLVNTPTTAIYDESNAFMTMSLYAQGPQAVSIAVSPSGKVGIMSKYRANYSSSYHYSPEYLFSELNGGNWHTQRALATDYRLQGPYGLDGTSNAMKVVYNASNEPLFLAGCGSGYNGGTNYGWGCSFAVRSGTTWTTQNGYFGPAWYIREVDFLLSGSDLHAALLGMDSNLYYLHSTDFGVTWSSATTATGGDSDSFRGAGISLNSADEPIIIYSNYFTGPNVYKLNRYNTVTANTTTIDSAANLAIKGYASYSGGAEVFYYSKAGIEEIAYDRPYDTGTATFNGTTAVVGIGTKWTTWLSAGTKIRLLADSEAAEAVVLSVQDDTHLTLTGTYSGSSTTGPYLARTRKIVTAPSSLVDSTYHTGTSFTLNGANFAQATFGLNANEVRIRRGTLFGSWASPIESDSTLSSWGSFAVSGEILNGNSILYEVGVATTSSITPANTATISSGSTVSTDPAKYFLQVTANFSLEAFSVASVQAITVGYVGAGVDAKTPFACVFNNETYISATQAGGLNNNKIIFLDRKHSWGIHSGEVSCLTRYSFNGSLYAGSATNGNVYRMNYGYNQLGNPYTLTATYKEDLLGSMELQKDIYKIYVIYKTQQAGTFDFSYRLDNFKDATAAWVTTTIDQTSEGVAEIPSVGVGTSIQCKVEQAGTDVQVGIIGFIILFGYLNVR